MSEPKAPPPLYIVMTSSAKSKGKWMSVRRNIAIIKTNEEVWPTRIDERESAIVEIVHHWTGLNVGKTDKSEYHKAMVEAERRCKELNHRDRPLSTMAREAVVREQT